MDENLFSPEFIEMYLHGIYLNVYNPRDLSYEYHSKVGIELENGLNKGYGERKVYDPVSRETITYNSLRENVWIFSAAKQYTQVRQMSAMISETSDFKTFRGKAMIVFDEFNKNYLKTEYNTAVGQSQMARDWVRSYDQREALPYLRYETQKDSHVRDEHAILDGITLPITDKFWGMYMPKNGWNCRCFTTQHDGGELTDLSKRDLTDLADERKFPEVFRMNPGKDGIVFSDKHPYFRVAKGDKSFREDNYNLPVPK
jgi:SPP1 gp7 family putative phage head morphogenesis protein